MSEINRSLREDFPFEQNSVIEAYKKFIDRSLLRENLKCTVEERFLRLMSLQSFAEELRKAPRKPISQNG